MVAILFRGGEEVWSLRKCLGSEDQHTVFEGEVTGMILAAELIRVEGYVCTVAIGTDGQAAIWATTSTRRALGQHLLAKLQNHLVLVQHACGDVAIILRWTPGHNGIHENERVDEEAKRATGGESSPVCLLPNACRGAIPVSRSLVCQNHLQMIKGKATEFLEKSLRYTWLMQIDTSMPLSRFRKITQDLPHA